MGGYWKTANTNEVLAITGWRVKGIKITQKSFIMPGQKVTVIDTMPRDYFLNLQAMTKEKLQCLIPVVFTVGPDVNKRGKNAKKGSQVFEEHHPEMTSTDGELADGKHSHRQRSARDIEAANQEDGGDALIKYCRLLGGSKGSDNDQKIENIVKGVIEGETRVLVSSMTMEELFSGREEFKNRISVGIQSEMDQFGLKIYNANVKELRDAPGSNYFHSLSQKAHEGAINRARVDVADAQAKGNIGEAQRHGEQNREIAKINAETAVQKTVRDSEKAKAEAALATNKAMYNRDVEIAQIEANRATESCDEALRKEVEMKRAQTELERLRASDVVKATVLRESKQQAADAKKYEAEAASNAQFYTEQKNADASAYNEQKAADARAYKVKTAAAADVENEKMASDAQMYKGQKAAETNAYNQKAIADAYAYKVKVEAEANFDAAQKDAEAILIRQQKEAEGMTAMAGAYGALSQAFGGPQGLIQYLMIEKGTYAQLANANANAVRGLNPKMTIWNTGSNAGQEGASNSGAGGVDSIRNMYQMLPPLMSTINEQTGITLPEWQFGRLGEQISEREVSGKSISGINGTGKTANGHSQRQ